MVTDGCANGVSHRHPFSSRSPPPRLASPRRRTLLTASFAGDRNPPLTSRPSTFLRIATFHGLITRAPFHGLDENEPSITHVPTFFRTREKSQGIRDRSNYISLLLSRDLFSRVNEGIKRVINRSSACINFDESKFFLFFSLSLSPPFFFFFFSRSRRKDGFGRSVRYNATDLRSRYATGNGR